jgi:hypothetical protein
MKMKPSDFIRHLCFAAFCGMFFVWEAPYFKDLSARQWAYMSNTRPVMYLSELWSTTSLKVFWSGGSSSQIAKVQCDMFDNVCEALHCVGDPCVVKNAPITYVDIALAAADNIRHENRKVIVDGNCPTICPLLLSRVSPSYVCATPNARISFTALYNTRTKEQVDPSPFLTPRLVEFIVREKNGFPGLGKPPLVFTREDVSKFWRDCTPDEVPSSQPKLAHKH